MNRIVPAVFVLLLFARTASSSSLDLAAANTGISLGNSPRFNGLRLNFSDTNVERLRGLNLTFWKPGGNDRLRHDGAGIALVGAGAAELNGIFVAGGGMASRLFRGVALAGLGASLDEMTGIAIAGLGIATDGGRGVIVGGLGAAVDDFTGIAVGGLGVGGDRMSGLFAGLVGVGGDELRGIALGGLGVGGDDIRGIAASLFKVGAGRLSGFAAAPYTDIGEVRGALVIGLYNSADTLHGVQIGVLNRAGNNPVPFRYLPFVNARFR